MNNHTFALWLQKEALSVRYALITLYEHRDKMQYIEGPRLEKEYMEKIGSYEQTVIREEMECELLQKKREMIQAAINRREPVNEAVIDKELEKYRQQMFEEAAGPAAPQEYGELSIEESEELQRLYRDIVRNFHPQVHPELTEAQRQLFDKAQEAYRLRDPEALKLIHGMLFDVRNDEMAMEILRELLFSANDEANKEKTQDMEYAADYILASVIYDSFRPTVEEMAIQEEAMGYRQLTDGVMKEMEELRKQFPYTAADMLADPAKIEAYRDELTLRMYAATAEKERRTKEIGMMIESVTVHE